GRGAGARGARDRRRARRPGRCLVGGLGAAARHGAGAGRTGGRGGEDLGATRAVTGLDGGISGGGALTVGEGPVGGGRRPERGAPRRRRTGPRRPGPAGDRRTAPLPPRARLRRLRADRPRTVAARAVGDPLLRAGRPALRAAGGSLPVAAGLDRRGRARGR